MCDSSPHPQIRSLLVHPVLFLVPSSDRAGEPSLAVPGKSGSHGQAMASQQHQNRRGPRGSQAPLLELWVHLQTTGQEANQGSTAEEKGATLPKLPSPASPPPREHSHLQVTMGWSQPHPEKLKGRKQQNGLGWINHFHHFVVSNQVYSKQGADRNGKPLLEVHAWLCSQRFTLCTPLNIIPGLE